MDNPVNLLPNDWDLAIKYAGALLKLGLQKIDFPRTKEILSILQNEISNFKILKYFKQGTIIKQKN